MKVLLLKKDFIFINNLNITQTIRVQDIRGLRDQVINKNSLESLKPRNLESSLAFFMSTKQK
jgi:hypothetical protein